MVRRQGQLGPEHCVIFDLDGTLVDSAPDLCEALNYIMRREDLAPFTLNEMRNYVGSGARGLLRQALAVHNKFVDDDTLGRWTEDFISYYGEHIADLSLPFEGARTVLDRLTAAGVKMGVCTNKREGLSRQLLKALDLEDYFPAILGSDTLSVRKPDPLHLLETIKRADGDPQASVMIGDSKTDVDTAKAAQVPCIGVTFGYSLVPLHGLEPEIVIEHFSALEEALAQVFQLS